MVLLNVRLPYPSFTNHLDKPLLTKVAVPRPDESAQLQSRLIALVDSRVLRVLYRNPPIPLNPEDDFGVTHQVTALDPMMGNTESLRSNFFDSQRVESGHFYTATVVYLHLVDRFNPTLGEYFSNCLHSSLLGLVSSSVKNPPPE